VRQGTLQKSGNSHHSLPTLNFASLPSLLGKCLTLRAAALHVLVLCLLATSLAPSLGQRALRWPLAQQLHSPSPPPLSCSSPACLLPPYPAANDH
jgi:hypothetical protein